MNKIEILDHGYIGIHERMGTDLSICQNARAMEEATWRGLSDEKLIAFLMKNRHTTPFEAVEFNFAVKLPIFVVRQWQRHRTWSYNEISGRYQELPEEFYIPEIHLIGTQNAKNHQSRDIGDGTEDSAAMEALQDEIWRIREHCTNAFSLYRSLLPPEDAPEDGWPRELARIMLPLGTYTKMLAKTDLHNLFHFLSLRMDVHAQYEIRVYADAIFDLINAYVPIACEAFWVHTLKRPVDDYLARYM